jgi:hypothetical protein
MRVTFKWLLLDSDTTSVMGDFFLSSRPNVLNFGLGLFCNEVLLYTVI